ncbi:MAG: phosphatidylserine decarboxylase family protein [Candidatus Sumerlaeaceae bacterium]
MKFSTTHPIAREAQPFLLISLVTALLLFAAGVWLPPHAFCFFLSVLSLLVSGYIAWFFRHPQRPVPSEEHALVCPADGTVVAVSQVAHPHFPGGQAMRVAIFMSLFDVHINWAPCDAVVEKTEYFPGRFLNAMEDKSSEENERKILYLRTSAGEPIIVKLVAGLIARRIVSPLEAQDRVQRGETIGLIRFGSRVEVLAPTIYRPCVQYGDKVRGRSTVLLRRTLQRDENPTGKS